MPLQPYRYIQSLLWMSSNSFRCTIIQFPSCPVPLGIAVVLLVGGGSEEQVTWSTEWLPPGEQKCLNKRIMHPPGAHGSVAQTHRVYQLLTKRYPCEGRVGLGEGS
jgi:hypothetical protein